MRDRRPPGDAAEGGRMVLRALAIAASLALAASNVLADCRPTGQPELVDRQLAAQICRDFQSQGATRVVVKRDRDGVMVHIWFESPDSIAFFENHQQEADKLLDVFPEVYVPKAKRPPGVGLAIWSTNSTDVIPRVQLMRMKPGGPITRVLSNGIVRKGDKKP
jgi:hypothetical protein